MFKELLVKEGYEYDYCFDWVILNDKLVNQSALTYVDNGEDQESSKLYDTLPVYRIIKYDQP